MGFYTLHDVPRLTVYVSRGASPAERDRRSNATVLIVDCDEDAAHTPMGHKGVVELWSSKVWR